jgi:antibiotic biosynthesis monooxygenase (ABM) superfamily enzyme
MPHMSAPVAPDALSADSSAPTPAPSPIVPPPAAPSVHVRAVITWLAIFPLVSVGMLVLAPFSGSWHPVLRALVLTAVVVPLAVYVVVPRLMHLHGALTRRRRR